MNTKPPAQIPDQMSGQTPVPMASQTPGPTSAPISNKILVPISARPPVKVLTRLAADPACALEGCRRIKRQQPAGQAWLDQRRAELWAFCTYAGLRELWAALHSVLFLVAASLLFGRIPELPLAILVLIPFAYLSALGALLLLAGLARDRVVGRLLRRLGRRFFGQEDYLAALARGGGQRLLRTAFGVGVYLLLGLVYLALGPDDDPVGWLLLPCLLAAMAAIYSLGRQVGGPAEIQAGVQTDGQAGVQTGGQAGVQTGGRVYSFRRGLLRRLAYSLVLVASLYLLSHYLFNLG